MRGLAPDLGGIGRENGGEAVKDLGAASFGVDKLGPRDGERDGAGSGGREAELHGSGSGLLGLPARVLGGHWAASVPVPVREGADAEEHLEALLL